MNEQHVENNIMIYKIMSGKQESAQYLDFIFKITLDYVKVCVVAEGKNKSYGVKIILESLFFFFFFS